MAMCFAAFAWGHQTPVASAFLWQSAPVTPEGVFRLLSYTADASLTPPGLFLPASWTEHLLRPLTLQLIDGQRGLSPTDL